MRKLLNEINGINFIDIGCGGGLPMKWHSLIKYINLFGFDPHINACNALSTKCDGFSSAKFLPYAISGKNGESKFYKTRSAYCFSLLRPNRDHIKRFFSYDEMYEIVSEEVVQTRTLDSIEELSNTDVDVIKIDSQGTEWPILLHAKHILERPFHVEIEVGFIEGYKGQKNSFGDIERLMQTYDYRIFNFTNCNRVPRNNKFKTNYRNEQLIYSDTTWLKDYISAFQNNKIDKDYFTRQKVLKILIICSLQGCLSYGLELAQFFYDLGFLSQEELEYLSVEKNWSLNILDGNKKLLIKNILNFTLRLLPRSLRRAIRNETELIEIHDFYKLLKKYNKPDRFVWW